jgi:hypothetical protein
MIDLSKHAYKKGGGGEELIHISWKPIYLQLIPFLCKIL